MDRTTQENWCDIFKKAKARKVCAHSFNYSNQFSDENHNELLIMLNEELLNGLLCIIKINPAANLAVLGRVYKRAAGRITGISESSYSFPSHVVYEKYNILKSVHDSFFKIQANLRAHLKLPGYSEIHNGEKLRTESYLVFRSLFSANPLLANIDRLTAFLEKNSGLTKEQERASIHYIRVRSIIKARGNPIEGPKKEDVGMYNRRIFDCYSKEINCLNQDQSIVNAKFFPRYDSFLGHDLVITSDFVQLYKFNGSSKQRLEESLFIIHQRDTKKKVTVLYCGKIIFNRLGKDQFKYTLSKCKRSINILHFETFTLYRVEFSYENAAIRAFTFFFSENERNYQLKT